MRKQQLTDELTDLQQRRFGLATQLDQMALQLQRWDEKILLLQQMLITLGTQVEQEERLGEFIETATTPLAIEATGLIGE